MMGDACQVDAHLPGDLRVGVAGIDARAHESGEIERRQAVALLVLSDLSVDIMGLGADDDRHDFKAGSLRCAEALSAEEDAIVAVVRTPLRNDGLKDAAQRDVLRELVDFCFGKFGPRVSGIFLEAVDRYQEGRAFGAECVDREDPPGSPGPDVFSRVREFGLAGPRIRLIDEIELVCVRSVPRHAHECIVPMRPASWKTLGVVEFDVVRPPRSRVVQRSPSRLLGLSHLVSTFSAPIRKAEPEWATTRRILLPSKVVEFM